MVQVRITDITGATYPVQVFISDVYGNYETLLGTISTGTTVPPTVYYNTVIPSIFQTAPEIMLTLVDAKGCRIFKILQCTFGCTLAACLYHPSCRCTPQPACHTTAQCQSCRPTMWCRLGCSPYRQSRQGNSSNAVRRCSLNQALGQQ